MRTTKTPRHVSAEARVPHRWAAMPGRSIAAWTADGELWCLVLIGLLVMLFHQQP
ncbi:MAG: hypothetical protein IT228_14700 [Flavobacteriales bacterium]|nr:hypothetical protein [Flavobacteriales bacterium]MCC6578588.1 hypothetical protein [Flavobacteriales bacterium]NUQ15983.1 hypothetical protein [Flavobacteriales bacterium]